MTQQPLANISYDAAARQWVASTSTGRGDFELARVDAAPGQEEADLKAEMAELGRLMGEAMVRLFM